MFQSLIEENQKLRGYIESLSLENQGLNQNINLLELQSKKRYQQQFKDAQKHKNAIQPVRSARKSSLERIQMSVKTPRLVQPFQDLSNVPIHERLHKEAQKKTQQQILNDVLKERHELEQCTFIPNASQVMTPAATQSTRRKEIEQTQSNLYERLSKSQKKINPQIMQMQKENEELKACTFKPETNLKSSTIMDQSHNNYKNKEKFYDRLYKEGETKMKHLRNLQILKQNSEVSQCTFIPETIKGANTERGRSNSLSMGQSITSVNSKENIEETFNRLHKDYEKNQRNKVKKENETNQKFKEEYPFQPTRISKQKDSQFTSGKQENVKERSERLFEAYKDKNKRLEEKRLEMEREEEKLHKMAIQSRPTAHYSSKSTLNKSIESQMNHNNFNSFTSNQQIESQRDVNSSRSHIEKLYSNGLDKQKKQNEIRERLFKEQGISFVPQTNNLHKEKYAQKLENTSIVERNQEFLQKKQDHIKEIEKQNTCDFKPKRVTTNSKCDRQYSKQNQENQIDLGSKLYKRGQEIEQKKEKMRQEHYIESTCTFKPQLSKNTNRILKERSLSKSSLGSSQMLATKESYDERRPLKNNENTYSDRDAINIKINY